MPPAAAAETLRFEHFELHPAERMLRVRGEPVALGGRAFDLLLALAQRHERLVTKQELLDLVWPGLVVEEHNIATQISSLRKLLGASAIATLPGLRLPLDGGAPRGDRTRAPAADLAASRPRHNLPDAAHALHRPRGGAGRPRAAAGVDAAADADRHRRLRQDAPGAAASRSSSSRPLPTACGSSTSRR